MRGIARLSLALLSGVAVQSPAPAAAPAAAVTSVPVIIDTDVGDDIDDAFALAIAPAGPAS